MTQLRQMEIKETIFYETPGAILKFLAAKRRMRLGA